MLFLDGLAENLSGKDSGENGECKKEFKILIIDDEVDLLKVLKMDIQDCYKEEGVKVDIAASGKEGLEYIKNNGYRLIFLDLKMPEINGDEVLREIRKKRKKYHVVIMTAYAESPVLDEVRKECDGFLEKPFKFVDLKRCIDEVIEGGVKNGAFGNLG